MSENKLNHIEETLAYQEQQISELNDVVTRQWNEIDLLKKHMAKMQDKIDAAEDMASLSEGGETLSFAEQAARDKPPHY